MKKTSVSLDDLRGVFSVPPLARKTDARRGFDRQENDRIARHITGGGITRLVYGGNAFLYHMDLAEYGNSYWNGCLRSRKISGPSRAPVRITGAPWTYLSGAPASEIPLPLRHGSPRARILGT